MLAPESSYKIYFKFTLGYLEVLLALEAFLFSCKGRKSSFY